MSESRLFFWLTLLLQVAPSVFSVVGHEPVQVTAGDDVILPCHLKPPLDVTDLTVQWKKDGVTVHLYTERTDSPDDQDEHFTGRTFLFHHEMTKGNISLKLTNVHEEDSGLYICYIPRLPKGHVKTGSVSLSVLGVDLRKELGESDSSDVVGHEPVQVAVGDDAILPCHLDPPFNLNNLTVKWTRNGRTVHLYTERADSSKDQDEQFRGRTSLFHHEMTRGNISLKLTNVTEGDAGLYIGRVPRLNSQVKKGNVLLSVMFSVVGHEPVQVTAGDDVILPCHLDPPFNVTKNTVEWTWDDLNVHVYRNRRDDRDLQDEHFTGRTSLFHHEMTKGNISLKLTKVAEEDSGLYICHVPKLPRSHVKKGNVNLIVLTVRGDTETRGVNEQIRDKKTGIFLGSISGVLLIIAVSAVIIYSVNKKTGFIKRWRREKNNQDNNQQREQPNPEEMKPLAPVPE